MERRPISKVNAGEVVRSARGYDLRDPVGNAVHDDREFRRVHHTEYLTGYHVWTLVFDDGFSLSGGAAMRIEVR